MSWLQPKTRKEVDDLTEVLAEQAFAEHQLSRTVGSAQQTIGAWHMRKPGTSFYWYEVIKTVDAGLFVHGDITPVVFKGGPRSQTGLEMLQWLAQSHLGYAYEKARIGMMDHSLRRADPAVALHELLDWRGSDWELSGSESTAIDEAIEMIRAGEPIEFAQNTLYDAGWESEYVAHLGQVTPISVVYAFHAVRRAAKVLALLKPEEARPADAL